MKEPDRPWSSDGDSGDESDNARGRLQGTRWVALLGTGAALLFLGGIALGASRVGGNFTASIGEAFRAAFGSGGRELVVPLAREERREASAVPREAPQEISEPCEEDGGGGEGPVFIAEVAWMGSRDRATDEWIELANSSESSVDMAGWQFYDRGRKISLTIPIGAVIPPRGRMLLVREGASVETHAAPVVMFRGALNNTNETITLFDRECEVADAVVAGPSWPAGNNSSKRTMERDLATLVWYDSASSGGTPGLPNSPPPTASTGSSGGTTPPQLRQIAPITSTVPGITPSSHKDTPTSTDQTPVRWCAQDNLLSPTGAVLLNEVAWAGTGPGKTADEWIELRNPSGAPVPLMGWQLLNRSRTIAFMFASSSILEPYGYFLIERKEDAVSWIQSDALFSGALKNNDESLRLFDRDCRLIDEVLAEAVWPAGTAAPEYRSAERSSDRSWHTFNWSPINGLYGTPRMVNSEPAPPPSSPTGGSGGNGGGGAWSNEPSSVSTATTSALISEVMAGSDGGASDEFVELYNPSDTPADLTGWCLKKRTSTGSESTLVAASRFEGISIASRRYLLLANDGGYRGAAAPDVRWPSSYTLAYTSNAVTLYRGCAERADEVSWTELSAGRSLVRDGWETNTFHVADTPSPTNASGDGQ